MAKPTDEELNARDLKDKQLAARTAKDDQIRGRFHYKRPTPTHQMYFDSVTDAVDNLVDVILTIPDGQERAVALTQLGLARMCINAAIANTPAKALENYEL